MCHHVTTSVTNNDDALHIKIIQLSPDLLSIERIKEVFFSNCENVTTMITWEMGIDGNKCMMPIEALISLS